MSWLVLLPTVIGLLAAAALAFCLAGERQILHPPRSQSRQPPPDGEEVTFLASDGVPIHGWYYALSQPRGVIAYGSGRGRGLNGFDFRYIPLFNRRGYSLLLFDARGLGASGGVSSMGALEWRDYLGAVDFLASRGVHRVGFCGGSQGGASAILAAARCPAAVAVVAESAYAAWATTVCFALQGYAHLPPVLARPGAWLLTRWIGLRLGFRLEDAEPVRVIAKLSPRAVFLIHGPHDPYIPTGEAQRLFDAAGQPKELWILPEAGHTQALELRPTEYETRVIGFFDRWLSARADGAGQA
jgi:dipeptidyl aminopeptidase/acylaminoacyl peptidase